jgi:hypothetical protein
MSRFRFSRWLAGLSSLFAVVLIAAGGASAQTITTWDFATLLGVGAGECSNLGTGDVDVSQTGFGFIRLRGAPLLTVKDDGVATERGLGLAQTAAEACVTQNEVGDGGAGTLLMNFDNVLPPFTTLTSVQLGSLQAGECYRLSISTDGGTIFGAATEVCNPPATETVTVPIGLLTDGLVLKFEKALCAPGTPTAGLCGGDNDYVVISATTSSPVGICHNIGGPRELGANCDATGCTVDLETGGTLTVAPGQFLGIIVPFNTLSEGALNAHIKHGDGPIVGQPFDPPLHLASTGQIHLASNVECLGTRIVTQPPDHGN